MLSKSDHECELPRVQFVLDINNSYMYSKPIPSSPVIYENTTFHLKIH